MNCTVKARGKEKKKEGKKNTKKPMGFFFLLLPYRKPAKFWNISYQIGFLSF